MPRPAQGSRVQPSSPGGTLPTRGFSTGAGAGTPLLKQGKEPEGSPGTRCRQDAGLTQRARGRGAGGCASGSQRQGDGRAGTRFPIRKGHSVLHTCHLKIHLSPRPVVLPSVCLPPAPETSRGPESTSRYTGLVSSFLLVSRICSLPPSAASPEARLPALFLYLCQQNIPDGPD